MKKFVKFLFIFVILLGIASVTFTFYKTIVKNDYAVVDFEQGV